MESNLSAQTATPPPQGDHCEWASIILGSLHFRHRCAEASISQFCAPSESFPRSPIRTDGTIAQIGGLYIEHNGKLEIRNSLLNVVLYDKPEIRKNDASEGPR
jgi:hypothetical protein